MDADQLDPDPPDPAPPDPDPPETDPPEAERVHATAMGFDRVAEIYERTRPGYPPAAVEAIVARLRVEPGRRIADLGAGTGKLTIPLLQAGAEIVATEPVPTMRVQLERAVPADLRDRLEVIDAPAESLPLDDASVHGVTAAQAFHWFDPLPALSEVRRVLMPDGWLAVVHNRRDLTTGPQAAIEDLLRAHRADTPSWVDTSWSDVLEDPPGFAPAELLTFANRQTADAERFVGRIASVSFVATLPPPTHRQVLDGARVLFTMLERDGFVDLDYVTEVRLLHREGR
jgi:ubiquinone/menaquinone biosynthesis C-methylase UbiE